MTDRHVKSAALGASDAFELLEYHHRHGPADTCPICYVAGVAIFVVATKLADSEVSEEDALTYIEDLMESIFLTYKEKRKEAGHESPPKSPDKRTLN